MRLRFRLLVPILAACAGPLLIEAQTGDIRGTINFPGRQLIASPVTGAPFSAQRVSEHMQVGSDGTRFSQTSRQETIYRDSQGRTRSERPVMAGPDPQPADVPVIVEIRDPLAHVGYILDTQNKVAHRVALEIPKSAATAPAGHLGYPPHSPDVDLGQQVMEGVTVEGHRTVHAWPAGSVGNDRQFQSVTEAWYSADLKENVLSRSTDPRTGEDIIKLIDISRSEPSTDLFQPPSDYSVVDETGPFRIQWTAARQ